MKRSLFMMLAGMAVTATLHAQTTLPTSWSFVGSPPVGWTTSGTSVYTGSGNTPPAGKFDSSGDYLEIFFADAPGQLTYFLTGNSFSGGTFTVEESVNGTVWTALHTFTNPPAATYTQFTDTPDPNSRYIRFYYTNKVSGNIGVDDINLAVAAAGPAQEINVVFNSATVINNGSVAFSGPVSSTTPVSFTIENQGTATPLNITSVTISGTNASDFVVSSTPSSIAASSSGSLVVDFTPSQAGTRQALLTIANDDANENPYVINLNGIGGSYASEPTASATNFTSSNVKSYRFTASYTAASPAPDGYLVLRSEGAPVSGAPADGSIYTRGDAIGNAKVVYMGPGTSVVPSNVVANTTYHFAVFSYNGTGQYTNYYQAAPLTGTVTSSGNMMGSYYSGINPSSATFVSDLHNLINPHTQIYYSNYGPTMIDLFTARDTSNGQRVVTCVYSGLQYVYTIPFDWSVMSREHTYAHSWMPTNPASGLKEYDDQHNLFPTHLANANTPRSNYPFGEVVNATYTFMGCQLGTDVNGKTVFEPRESQKGDVARALMYMAVSYNGVSGNDWSFPNPISASIPYGQNQNVLKMWHYQDPPDAYEIARNDFLDSLQGNRNPFVDNVDYACYIDFYTMNYISNPGLPCSTSSIGINEEAANNMLDIYPNPAENTFNLSYSTGNNEEAVVRMLDVTGRVVYEKRIAGSKGMNYSMHDVSGISAGVYTVEVKIGNSIRKEKLIIQ